MVTVNFDIPISAGTLFFMDTPEQVITEVLRHRSETSRVEAINRGLDRISMPGFPKHASRTPIGRLAPAAHRFLGYTATHPGIPENRRFPAGPLFLAWRELQLPQFETLEVFFSRSAITTLTDGKFSAMINPDDLNTKLGGFIPPAGISPEYIQLGASLVCGLRVSSHEILEEVEQQMPSVANLSVIDPYLETRRAQSPEDELWDSVNEMLTAIETLAGEKIAARRTHVDRLESKIAEFELGPEPMYIGLTIPLNWTNTDCDPDEAEWSQLYPLLVHLNRGVATTCNRARYMRNQLAHYNTISFQDFREFWRNCKIARPKTEVVSIFCRSDNQRGHSVSGQRFDLSQ